MRNVMSTSMRSFVRRQGGSGPDVGVLSGFAAAALHGSKWVDDAQVVATKLNNSLVTAVGYWILRSRMERPTITLSLRLIPATSKAWIQTRRPLLFRRRL